MFILMKYCQKSSLGTTLPPQLPGSYTVVSDHPRAVEILLGCGLHSGLAPVRIPISFQPQPMQTAAGWVLSQARSLYLFKWTAGAETFWANS